MSRKYIMFVGLMFLTFSCAPISKRSIASEDGVIVKGDKASSMLKTLKKHKLITYDGFNTGKAFFRFSAENECSFLLMNDGKRTLTCDEKKIASEGVASSVLKKLIDYKFIKHKDTHEYGTTYNILINECSYEEDIKRLVCTP